MKGLLIAKSLILKDDKVPLIDSIELRVVAKNIEKIGWEIRLHLCKDNQSVLNLTIDAIEPVQLEYGDEIDADKVVGLFLQDYLGELKIVMRQNPPHEDRIRFEFAKHGIVSHFASLAVDIAKFYGLTV